MTSWKVRVAVLLGLVVGILQMGREAVGIYTYLSLSISDSSVTEPDSGSVAAQFIVSLSATSRQTVTVSFVTQDGTAKAPTTTRRSRESSRSDPASGPTRSASRSSETPWTRRTRPSS
jgi:hypothetical protein